LTQSGRERGGEREKERGKERERERARANEREREKERKKETVKKHHLRFLFSSGFPVRFNPFYFYFRALPSSTWQCRRDFEELVP
jgi:hypothetical protein